MAIFLIFQNIKNCPKKFVAACQSWEDAQKYLMCHGEVLAARMDTYLGDRMYWVYNQKFNGSWPQFPIMDIKEIEVDVIHIPRFPGDPKDKRTYTVVLSEFWQPPKYDVNDLLKKYGTRHQT